MSPGSSVGRGMSANPFDGESGVHEAPPVLVVVRKVPGLYRALVDALPLEAGAQRRHDPGHAAASAKLADEASPGHERAPDTGDDGVGVEHPVERGVAEHRVELGVEGEPLPITHPGVETALARRSHLRCAAVDADDAAAARDELLGERPVAAAEVEDAFARYRRQELEHRRAQLRHEAGGARVAFRIPVLGYGRASSTMLKGVSVARRKRRKPPAVTTSRSRASPACAPSASPTSCASDAGVQMSVDAE